MYLATEARWEETRLGRFIAHNGFGFLEELHGWSLRKPRYFWSAVADEVGLVCLEGAPGPEGAEPWLEPRGFDAAASLLGLHAACAPQRLALSAATLSGEWAERTYAELSADVARVTAGLVQSGIQRGDRVGVALPIGLEAVTAMLGLFRVGADIVWLGATRNGARQQSVAGCRWLIGGIEPLAASPEARTITYGSLLAVNDPGELPTPCSSALLELPGLPAQPIGGLTLKAAWDLAAALDLREGDVLMVRAESSSPLWPWLVLGCLQLGAGLVIADRAAPGGGIVRAVSHGITHLGFCGATLKTDRGIPGTPLEGLDSEALRLVAIFDGRIDAMAWNWLFEQIGHCRFPLVNCFGGPAWGGLLLAAFPGLPVKPCSLIAPLPGVDICMDIATGNSAGRLVCGNRWPGMPQPLGDFARAPVRAWIDPDGYWFLV